MEVKIKSKEGLLEATIEMIDGVMVVSPKKENDVAKFKTGDIITCGWEEDGKSCSWVSILDGRIEEELFESSRKSIFETNAQSCEIWNQIKDLDKKASPCDKCPNNKANNPNASGICHCAAPYFANPIT